MNKRNLQAECDRITAKIEENGKKPSLLLHVCCAPCASYVIEYLEKFFELSLYFYNPNITDAGEFALRQDELARFVRERPGKNHCIITPHYDPKEFFKMAEGLEDALEGGERCGKCYRLRLEATAQYAKNRGYDYFTSTLSVSPYKNAECLGKIGDELAEQYSVSYLPSDFKKRGGYLRTIEMSSVYNLYRQDYCGCAFSRKEAQIRREKVN